MQEAGGDSSSSDSEGGKLRSLAAKPQAQKKHKHEGLGSEQQQQGLGKAGLSGGGPVIGSGSRAVLSKASLLEVPEDKLSKSQKKRRRQQERKKQQQKEQEQ